MPAWLPAAGAAVLAVVLLVAGLAPSGWPLPIAPEPGARLTPEPVRATTRPAVAVPQPADSKTERTSKREEPDQPAEPETAEPRRLRARSGGVREVDRSARNHRGGSQAGLGRVPCDLCCRAPRAPGWRPAHRARETARCRRPRGCFAHRGCRRDADGWLRRREVVSVASGVRATCCADRNVWCGLTVMLCALAETEGKDFKSSTRPNGQLLAP